VQLWHYQNVHAGVTMLPLFDVCVAVMSQTVLNSSKGFWYFIAAINDMLPLLMSVTVMSQAAMACQTLSALYQSAQRSTQRYNLLLNWSGLQFMSLHDHAVLAVMPWYSRNFVKLFPTTSIFQ